MRGEAWTASFIPGPCGLLDGTLSFTDGERTLSFTGFTCAIDDIAVGDGPLDARCTGFEVEAPGGSGAQPPSFALLHRIDLRDGRAVVARATLRADGPALRIAWDMPGATRSPRGSPRFTRLGIGPASLPSARAYMSFGNVLEEPCSFELTGGLFKNMASHAGADYANGASLCQAADGIPDRILCRRESNVFAVETAGDATFSFVPSARGAFAAARAWREVSGVRRSVGWREAATRMCFDQWGNVANQNTNVTAALDRIGRYGVTNAIYVRHVWQRWGFDYRLPEIWPPGTWVGDHETFAEMRETARRHGILFVLHDNYIDHYPDAAGFSYDDTVFDEDGAPVKAWFNFNKGKRAQSYRWAPGTFLSALRANAATLRDGCAPDGTFLDVFSNMAPFDWFDRDGRFHDRAETRAAWGEAFDEYRRILGTNTITIGEGGHDALVGHLDAGQPDHFTPARWMDRGEYADAERVPWHDIVTHGSLVLYGGGLGGRYASDSPDRGGDPEKGCASDSYLCTTVIGGRTPLHDFDPTQINFRCVGTWWLLGDITRALALAEFESFDFVGSIHRQHAVFSGGGNVWVNRPHGGASSPSEPHSCWLLPNGLSLPPDGFYAETPGARAGIVEIEGRRCAFAASDNAIFVDGRPDRHDGSGHRPDAQALANFTALGMCGVFTAVMRTSLAGIFLIAETTGGYKLLVPLMLVSGVSWYVGRLFEPHSIYRRSLFRQHLVADDNDNAFLKRLCVGDCVLPMSITLKPTDTLKDAEVLVRRNRRNAIDVYPIVNDAGRLIGMLPYDKLLSIILRSSVPSSYNVSEIMDLPDGMTHSNDGLDQAMARMEMWHLRYVPVSDQATGCFLGLASKDSIFDKYRKLNAEIER